MSPRSGQLLFDWARTDLTGGFDWARPDDDVDDDDEEEEDEE